MQRGVMSAMLVVAALLRYGSVWSRCTGARSLHGRYRHL